MATKCGFRRCFELSILASLLLLACSRSIDAQTLTIEPAVDSLSLWGTCTPPGLRCTLDTSGEKIDRVVFRAYGGELIRGDPRIQVLARYDSMFFQIDDTLGLNRYEILFTNHSPWNPDHFAIAFDTVIWVFPGPCDLCLRVHRGDSVVDSGLIQFTSYQTGLSVGDDLSTIPRETCLLQNFPNPFNPVTTIRFALPRRATVELAFFNSLGQRVAVLAGGEMEAGFHNIRFDASGYSSGVYLYRLSAGGVVQTRKFLLLK